MPKTINAPSIADDPSQFIPQSAYDLIEFLAEQYPQRCVLSGEAETEAHRYAGAAQLVADLVEWKARETASSR
jgi:hypothetical protein